MIPKRVTLKNFLSFGDAEQTFDFTDDEALWILTGPNGVGKSAVFDAITYCLFGQHRGGKSDHAELIRHGSNLFRVAFEFEFCGVDYRITRTRGSNTTQRVETKPRGSEDWTPVPNVNNVSEVDSWVGDTLGLAFEAFTKSVLLRQGESDAIILARGSERLEMLKRIIDVERFESLSERIAEATKECNSKLKQLKQRRESAVVVTEDEVAEAQAALQDAEAQRELARVAEAEATQRVEQARQYTRLEVEQKGLAEKLREADSRSRDRATILESHEKFVTLGEVLPKLRRIAVVQKGLADAEATRTLRTESMATARAKREEHSSALETARQKSALHLKTKQDSEAEAKQIGSEIDSDSRFVDTAESVSKLEQELAVFAPDLDARLQSARDSHVRAKEDADAASNTKTRAETLLAEKTKQSKEFETVGAACPRCRQPVDAKHAADEKAKFAEEIAALTQQAADAVLAQKSAKHRIEGAKAELELLQDDVSKRNEARRTHTLQRKILTDFGIQADLAELNQRIAQKKLAQADHEKLAKAEAELANSAAAEANLHDSKCREFTKQIDAIGEELQSLTTSVAADGREYETMLQQLKPDWQARAKQITEKEIGTLDDEHRELGRNDVARRFAELQADSGSREGWTSRLQAIALELESLPAGSVADAEAIVANARLAVKAAGAARDVAHSESENRVRAAAAYRELVEQLTLAETLHDRHQKLNRWLGREGLLRELVREAERDIVFFAQDTLRTLSGGDLEIVLDCESDGREALVLVVRRAGDPNVTPVKFLSGSQKFRVAVAIAVAIGKFAAGPAAARPLESVIIDEGFGSLDKDGLQSMRDELENLKRSQSLKRVILVSHQEEFTSTFPVGYRLHPGDAGTTATRFRNA